MVWLGGEVLYVVSSRLWKKFADCLVSLLDFDVLFLAGDLKGFGSLRGALCARHKEIHYIFEPA